MAQAEGKCGRFTVTTPGKIILSGEHAVVYGKLALAASVDLLTTIDVAIHHDPFISIYLDDLDFHWSLPVGDLELHQCSVPHLNRDVLDRLKLLMPADAGPPVHSSLLSLCYLYCCLLRNAVGFEMRIKSAIPIGAGLGSSAAFSVALSAAFHALNHLVSSPTKMDDIATDGFVADKASVNCWAFECENIFHSTPSGIDNAVCTYGGVVKFQNRVVVDSIAIPEARIVLVNTQVSRQTKSLVELIRRTRDTFPAVVDLVLESINQLSHEIARIVQLPSGINYPAIQVFCFVLFLFFPSSFFSVFPSFLIFERLYRVFS